MPKPFFTVVIPTLNEAEYLPRLLYDLVGQKEKSFEVIVVDGKSTDETVHMAESFKDKLHISVFLSDKKNVSVQRNIGGSYAKGKYLVFFDADVQIPTDYLAQIHKNLEIHASPLLTTYLKPDSKIIADKIIATFFNLGLEASLFVERPFVPGFNFIVRRDVFMRVGKFREQVVHGEDYDLSVRLYKANYPEVILKRPRLTFSLRRYRAEGRLSVIRKYARATVHVFTKGQITRQIFDYPMGGGWYKSHPKPKSNGFDRAERYVKKLVKIFLES